MNLSRSGVNYDFTAAIGGLSESTVNIIESNANTQTNIEVKGISLVFANGVPVTVNRYSNAQKTDLIDSYAITWLNGVPISVVRNNIDNNITVTTTIEWADGIPLNITKV